MTTKDIRTSNVQVTCDVCGRTLLRGEHAETYLAGGSRRQVCELCSARAVNEGWVREGVALERATRSFGGERRRSLLGRLWRTGAGRRSDGAPAIASAQANASRNGWHEGANEHVSAAASASSPRQVRAVPTSVEQRTLTAVERFNRSEHPRTVAGVARSLGAPVVVVRPAEPQGSLMTVVVSWELCWYRYEIDLSDDGSAVRPAGQGYELTEIPVEDRVEANAATDEYGTLELL
jgi:hypothetical protein